MDNTLQTLQAKFQELEKRLKEINTAQNFMSQLFTLKEYVSQIQAYLKDLNTSFNGHIKQSQDYSEQIANMQMLIDEMNNKIKDLPSLDNYNPEQILQDIQMLQHSLQNISTHLSTLKGNSLSTLETLDTQISTINTNISTMNSTLDENSSQISTNTNDISALKTTTKNHTTTINNLTSSNNNLTSTVSNINTRLTSAEQELSAITGGVDLTELDERVEGVEGRTAFLSTNYHLEQKYNLLTKYFTTPLFQFYCTNRPITHAIKISYTSNASGTLKIVAYTLNTQTINEITINLSEFPSEYSYTLEHFATRKVTSLRLKFTSSEDITIKGLTIDSFGVGLGYSNYLPEIDAQCFDGKIFVTKREEDGIRYGFFNSEDELDLSNLPNKFLYLNEDGSRYSYGVYLPYTSYDAETLTYTGYTDGILIGNKFIPKNLTSVQDPPVQSNISLYNYEACFYLAGVAATPAMCYFSSGSDAVYYKEACKGSASGVLMESHLFATLVRNNNQGIGSTYKTNSTKVDVLALKCADGCFYVKIADSRIKIDKKNCVFGTAYTQADGSVNVYLSDREKTYKYSIKLNEENKYIVTLSQTYTNCDCVYELYNKIIKHNPISKAWSVADK